MFSQTERHKTRVKQPNFLIIGAAKAGTTTLHNHLKVHPQVFMSPIKETNFFALEGKGLQSYWQGYALSRSVPSNLIVDDWQKYKNLFRDASVNADAIGESSPAYLYVPQAAHRIRHHLPDVKLVAVLRNPVERAYSHYLYYLRDGRERQSDFLKALEEEQERMDRGLETTWSYRDMGFYHAQLKPYFELFDPSQIKVYLFEDFKKSPAGLLKNLCSFLEIDPSLLPHKVRRDNVSGMARSRWFQNIIIRDNAVKRVMKPLLSEEQKQRLLTGAQLLNVKRMPAMSDVARSHLSEIYKEDVTKLQDLIGRDLSNWMQSSPERVQEG